MKILTLSMQAFGPFAKPCTIDFAPALAEGLFLIQGPTGSGKTSILDAICFALYGASSGNERPAAGMRSHHAAPETATVVELDFEISGRIYRIRRQMSGRKSAAAHEKVQLEDRGVAATFMDTGRIVSDKRSEVQQAINALLHLDETQFRQVIVLPQGKFRELLVAKSQVREEILKSLFDTARLEDLVERVLVRRRQQEELCQKISQEIQFKQENLAVQNVQELPQLVAELTQKLASLDAELEDAREAAKTSRIDWENGRKLSELHSEAAQNRQLLEELERDRPDNERLVLKNARSALTLRATRGVLEQNRQVQNSIQHELEVLRRELEQQAAVHAEAVQKHDAATRERQEVSVLRDRLAEKRAVLPDFANLQQEKELLHTVETEKKKAEQTLIELNEGLRTLQAHYERTVLEREQHKVWATQLGFTEKLHRALAELAQNRQGHAYTLREQEALAEESRRNTREIATVSTELARLHQAMDQATSEEKRHDAGELARELRDGEPCPVCGSVHHPTPAAALSNRTKGSGRADLELSARKNQDVLHSLEIQAQITLERLKRAHSELAAADNEAARLQTQLTETIAEGSAYPADIDTFLKTLTPRNLSPAELLSRQEDAGSFVRRAQTSLSSSTQLDKQCAALEQSRIDANEARHAQESALAVLNEKLGQLALHSSEMEARLSGIVGGLANHPNSEAAFRQALDTEAAHIAAIEKNWEDSSRTLNEITLLLAVGHTRQTELQRAAETQAAAAVTLHKEWLAQISAHGFATEQEALDSFLDEETMRALEASIASWDRQHLVTSEKLLSLESQLGNTTPPDLNVLEQAFQQSEQHSVILERQRALDHQTLQNVRTGMEQIGALAEKHSAAIERLNSLSALTRLLQGTDADGSYINLQRYALSVYLDEILEYANRHLSDMSRGRYELVREDVAEGRRKSGGLELQILDSYTGTQRITESLSGGESFLAALSLALGLSSVVHQRSGGLRLDTLFVDEGFGSLDEEALQDAMNVLGRLHERGRTVGIISHVRELQERIQVQLVVSRSPVGSSASWKA